MFWCQLTKKRKGALVPRNKGCTKHVAVPIVCGKYEETQGQQFYMTSYLSHIYHSSLKSKGGSG